MSQFERYLRELQEPTVYPTAKLYLLNPDETIDYEVSSEFLSGNISVTRNNGVRRTATITISNADKVFKIGINNIWFGQKVRIDAGIRFSDGSEYLICQGIFYIKDPTESYNPTANTMTLNLVDKFAWLDGSLNGTLSGIHQINPGDDMRVAAAGLLSQDAGNGLSVDCAPPIFDSYYNDKVATLTDGSTVPFTNAPYTYRTNEGATRGDVLLAINTMLVASCGYDTYGRFRYWSAQADIVDKNRPVAWEFSTDKAELLGIESTHQMSSMYNDVKVVGSIINGVQVTGRATNKNPMSDTNVNRIGYKTYTINDTKYYTYDQANEAAKYELRNRTILSRSVTIASSPLYHIQEGDLVTFLDPSKSLIPEKYLVTGFTLPINMIGSMSITAVSVNEIDLYDTWLPNYELTILCSEMDALTVTLDNGVKTEFDNPYVISEVPAGLKVFMNASGNPSYTITSVMLNGVYIPHEGSSCEFIMPNYDSKVIVSLSLTSGIEVYGDAISYTGAIEEIEDSEGVGYKTIDGNKYRVYKLVSSGTLTLSEDLVDKGVIADVHCRGGGGGSSDKADGKNGYDQAESGLVLNEITEVTIGTGGVYGADKGKRGTATAFGMLIEAAGGSAATNSSSGYGGSLKNIFGSDFEDTETGKGGVIGNAGNDGAVWIRIAI